MCSVTNNTSKHTQKLPHDPLSIPSFAVALGFGNAGVYSEPVTRCVGTHTHDNSICDAQRENPSLCGRLAARAKCHFSEENPLELFVFCLRVFFLVLLQSSVACARLQIGICAEHTKTPGGLQGVDYVTDSEYVQLYERAYLIERRAFYANANRAAKRLQVTIATS